MISQAEIESLDWEKLDSSASYILYGTDFATDELDFSVLMQKGINWLIRYKTEETYFGELKTITDLQNAMTTLDIP